MLSLAIASRNVRVPSCTKGQRSVVSSQDRIQTDGNSGGGGGPDELEERGQHHPAVVRRQPGEIDGALTGVPNGTRLKMAAAEQAMNRTPTAIAFALYEGVSMSRASVLSELISAPVIAP